MFGLSFAKLLLLAVAAVLVWYGFKLMRRRDRRRAEAPRPAEKVAETPAAEMMVKCEVCGTYNPAGVVCTHRS